ncbi:MAG: AMP-binding protein [Deltaproteobacteria bacterium]|nr:AMP-binding protein [Deltaproteobacteria bacterium]MBW2392683.1 AMP-binding protein [Deltaproteobacteria bacterium]
MRDRSPFILADLVQLRAEEKPDLDVLTFERFSLDKGATPDEVRTYADLQINANRIAANLVKGGMQPGDRFAIMMRNHPEFVEAMIAASITGCIFVPIDPRTRGEKLAFLLRNSGCRGVISADYSAPALLEVRGQAADLEWLLVLASGDPAATSLTDMPDVASLDAVLSAPAESVKMRVEDVSQPLQIIYTSGTTGDPKGIVGDHMRFGGTGMLGGIFGYSEDERPYTGLSFTHNNAQATALAPALMSGYRAVISRSFSKSSLWEVCRRYGCTSFSLVGGMATAIYSEPPREDDAENPVRMVVSGGMPAAIWEPFERRFGVQIFEFYGASDGGGMAYKPAGVGPVGSFGKPMSGLDMRVLDENGRECASGVIGEICCRPEGAGEASVEYFGNPEASRKKIRDGWNRSGDMGHRDAEGWLYFDYRSGGGIRHNGDFVNPGFVEKWIAEDPQVSDVFVYGVPAASEAPGERDVVAAIVPGNADAFDPAALFAHCRAGLEPNFVPSYFQLMDEIPKTASEKPREHVLRDRFEAHAPDVCRRDP